MAPPAWQRRRRRRRSVPSTPPRGQSGAAASRQPAPDRSRPRLVSVDPTPPDPPRLSGGRVRRSHSSTKLWFQFRLDPAQPQTDPLRVQTQPTSPDLTRPASTSDTTRLDLTYSQFRPGLILTPTRFSSSPDLSRIQPRSTRTQPRPVQVPAPSKPRPDLSHPVLARFVPPPGVNRLRRYRSDG